MFIVFADACDHAHYTLHNRTYFAGLFLRIPEIVFQPTMVGVDQCGISDTIEFILQYYPPEVQQRLVEV
jgi:hypothetical protein